tara:strand:+ start:1862 stop:2284 length:423 start_codon:yes stop_codon:yes gene_type:complete
MTDVIYVALFPNEAPGNVSTIETISDGKVHRLSITPTEFLMGWTGHRPPFGNSNGKIPRLGPNIWDVVAWANADKVCKWVDASGHQQTVTVARRKWNEANQAHEDIPSQRSSDPTPPPSIEAAVLSYLNVKISPKTDEGK